MTAPTRRMLPEMAELAGANVGLAYSRALRMARLWPALDADDLTGEALLALVRAAWHWDAGRGIAFSTYAVHAIDRQMWHHITRESRHAGERLESLAEGGYEPVAPPVEDEEALAREHLRRQAQALLRTAPGLSSLGRRVVLAKLANPKRTYAHIGREFGVSKEGARQAALSVYPRLREMLADAGDVT